MPAAINMIGFQSGRLTVLQRDDEYAKKNNLRKKEIYWKC